MNAPKLFAQGTICNSIPLLTDEIAFYDDIFLASVQQRLQQFSNETYFDVFYK